ncbi:MAG: hypothetical protein NT145_02685 [Elusimicrobia bacterium]|nr:hypothetical protein [Elusimicrobiota bacterium]
MKKKIYIILMTAFIFASCNMTQAPVQVSSSIKAQPIALKVQVEQKKEEIVRYIYRGDLYRDPFFPITAEMTGPQEGIVIPSLGALVLTGIIRDRDQSIALLKGGSIGYTLKNGRIYDSRQRLIKGMSGTIKAESVVIIAADRSKKEIRLREKEK